MTRTLHIDCFSGISGDMTVGALIDLGVPEALVLEALESLGLPAKATVGRIKKGGFAAARFEVQAEHEHAHRHLSHINRILDGGRLTDNARDIARRMFEKLAEAEAHSHGVPIEKVHFHEVGAVDSIYDFVGIAVGIDHLAAERITARPVPTGSGLVRCEHGLLPVPAPAVARLLVGIPLAPCAIEAELTTPTGAAVLATLVDEFTAQPVFTIERTGLGAGTRDFPEQPNVLRLLLGSGATEADGASRGDTVWQLETNLDDVPAEVVGYCFDRLFEAGALDVFTMPIQMKKNRPGMLLSVLCDATRLAALEEVLFRETGTFGIRRRQVTRSKLARQAVEVSTPWGPVRGKLGSNDQVRVFTPEYDDCAALAQRRGVPLRDVYRLAVRQFEERQ